MYKKYLPLVLTALVAPSFGQLASGESPSPAHVISEPTRAAVQGLTLDAALQAVQRNSPHLRAAELEIQASDGAVQQASVLPNPVLGIEQEDTRRETRSTTVQLSQAFELGGKRQARVELARRNRDLAVADLASRRAELRASAIQAFFEALIAQERVKVAGESTAIAARAADAAARRVTAGRVSPIEETRARVAEANARIELSQAQGELSGALHSLAAVMGVKDGTVSQLDGRPEALPPLPANNMLAQRLSESPALRRAQLEVHRAQAAYQVERTRRAPDVTVSAGIKRSQELGHNQAVFGISVPLPLFDVNQGAQLEALRRREAAQAQAQAVALQLRAEVMQAADQLHARSREVAVLQKEVLPGARSAYEAASRGFELGKFSFLEVLDAQRTWLQARSQYLNALAQGHRAFSDLERRLGVANNRPASGTEQ